MNKLLIVAAVSVGLSLGVAVPASAAARPSSQCQQAQTAVQKLRAAADNTSDPRLQRAYTDMANAQAAALKYYC
jgi:hypothetical protein